MEVVNEVFQVGDKVIMNGKYYVAEHNKSRIFTIKEEPQPATGLDGVWLDGYPFCYSADGLTLTETK